MNRYFPFPLRRRPGPRRAGVLWLTAIVIACAWVSAPMRGMSVVPPKFTELVNGSDFIVRTVVKSVSCAWREKQGRGHIFTFVELEVKEVIAGTPPRPLVLELLGGTVGDQTVVVEGAPQFAVGQEDILFVRGNGRQFMPLTAVTHGRYPILRVAVTKREYVARNNLAPLHDTAEVANPLGEGVKAESQKTADAATALTPAAFIQQIRAAVGTPTTNATTR